MTRWHDRAWTPYRAAGSQSGSDGSLSASSGCRPLGLAEGSTTARRLLTKRTSYTQGRERVEPACAAGVVEVDMHDLEDLLQTLHHEPVALRLEPLRLLIAHPVELDGHLIDPVQNLVR